MVEVFVELDHWGHPVSEAVITDLCIFGVVPSLDEALVGSTDEGSVELWVGKNGFWVNIALNLLLWDLSLDWKEIEWSDHLWLMVLVVSVMVMTVVFMVLSLISFTLVMMVMSVMFMVVLEHLHEMWMSRCGGNAEKGNESKLVHFFDIKINYNPSDLFLIYTK